MAYKDLREFIAELEKRNLLKRIKFPVDAQLEITEITDRVSKFRDARNVALLFENVRGYDIPVLMNALGSYERMALALGVEKLDDAADDIREIMKLPYLSFKNRSNIFSIVSTAHKA
ncbi:MAG: UbiD family decarboxylase, partial [Selenomonadaceae bacterium]|nr:UbiD family decarboxylase [Selenomonadaceae bacterium]